MKDVYPKGLPASGVKRLAILENGSTWALYAHGADLVAIPVTSASTLPSGLYVPRRSGETVYLEWPVYGRLSMARITPVPVPIEIERDHASTIVRAVQDGETIVFRAPYPSPPVVTFARLHAGHPGKGKQAIELHRAVSDSWSLTTLFTGRDLRITLSPAVYALLWPQSPKQLWLEVINENDR